MSAKTFFSILSVDIKQGMSWRLPLSLFLVPSLILMDNYIDIAPHLRTNTGSLFYYFYGSVSFGGLFGIYLASMVSAIPYATRFCREYNDGIFLYAIQRSGRNGYALSKFVVSALWGGFVLGGGYLLLFIVLSFRMPQFMPHELDFLFSGDPLPFTLSIISGKQNLYFITAIYMGFLSGALYAGISVLVSAFIPSVYVVLITPFVTTYCMVYGSKLLGIPDEIRLDMWFKMRSNYISDELTIALCTILTLTILLVCAIVFVKKMKWRMQNECIS